MAIPDEHDTDNPSPGDGLETFASARHGCERKCLQGAHGDSVSFRACNKEYFHWR